MAAEMGDELRMLKEQHSQGLLTEDQYRICCQRAVEKYNNSNDAQAQHSAPQHQSYQAESSGYQPYRQHDSGKGGGKGKGKGKGKGGKGGKMGKMGKGAPAPEPVGPVYKQTPQKSYPSFDPDQERTGSYRSEAAQEIHDHLVRCINEAGGEALLSVAIGTICKDINQRLTYEEVLGNLSPQV
eukprot:TRINITY_DN22379_c0_g1_i1.p1 TRINITY_DN22379_c0_g1~~TRINITY_DN22379_c0_g1_i1.p1  ORF type:complete len:200 (+),score=47.45 TRINITY_DN22379_c0_g1_i1:54-602(+)